MNLIPKKTISRMVGGFARSACSKGLVPMFARHYQIDPNQAEMDIKDYSSLTDFFTRNLKPGLRPVVQGDKLLASPVDGVLSQAGPIDAGVLLQAKGVSYSVLELLGQDRDMAERFHAGSYFTIYLSPRDYHKIHAPIQGRVVRSTYVPGTLFPVNPFGVRAIKGLFTRNERLITYLNTHAGLVAVVKVGAIIVGSVKVTYCDVSTNLQGNRPETRVFEAGPNLDRGEEFGRFEFGSTVIVLCEKHVVPSLMTGERVLMGQEIGVFSL